MLGTINLRDKASTSLANKEITIDYGYKIMPNEYILVKTKEKFNFPAFFKLVILDQEQLSQDWV